MTKHPTPEGWEAATWQRGQRRAYRQTIVGAVLAAARVAGETPGAGQRRPYQN